MPARQMEIRRNQEQLRKRNQLYRRYGYDSRRAALFVLRAAGPLGRRTLEIGTGKGRFLVELARRVPRVVTVDPDAGEQRFARLNAAYAGLGRKIRFVEADGAALPFPGRSFDSVVSFNALHHIRNLDAVLSEIVRVVKPGGTIVLADFDAGGFRIFDRIHAAEGRVHERQVYRWPHIAARLRRAGFQVRHARGERTAVVIATASGPLASRGARLNARGIDTARQSAKVNR